MATELNCNSIDFYTFCGLSEALAGGDHAAAEWADMSADDFARLRWRETSVNHDRPDVLIERERAAIRIQANARGRQTRQMLNNQDLSSPHLESAECMQAGEMQQNIHGECKDSFKQQEQAAVLIQASARGRQTRKMLQLNSGRNSGAQKENAALVIQAHVRGMETRKELQLKDKAAQKLQAAGRRWLARRKVRHATSMGAVVEVVSRRHAAWVSLFEDVANEGQTVDATSFSSVLHQIHPRLSDAQVSALWRGFAGQTDSSGTDRMGVASFCAICEGVASGDTVAAEIADMDVESFQALGERPNLPSHS